MDTGKANYYVQLMFSILCGSIFQPKYAENICHRFYLAFTSCLAAFGIFAFNQLLMCNDD